MTRLRWANAPYEPDPARVQPLPADNWPRQTSRYRADPNNLLMHRCLSARREYLQADAHVKKLLRKCRIAEEELRVCRNSKKERVKDKIAGLERELVVADAVSKTKLQDYLTLVSLWRERHPAEA